MPFVCILLPAVLWSFFKTVWKEGYKEKSTVSKGVSFFLNYACGALVINLAISAIWFLITGKLGDVFSKIANDRGFAVKYLVLSVLLAVTMPYFGRYRLSQIHVLFAINEKCAVRSEKKEKIILYAYTAALAAHHFIRLFDNCFWGDEGIVVEAAKHTWVGMLEYIAGSGHTPFYYAFAWLFVRLFGQTGFTYHLSAALPYFVLMILSATIIRRWFGFEAALITETLCTFLGCAVIYNLEIRMYAWCQLFVLLVYLMAYRLYKTGEGKYYILMALFSVGAVYGHYFALVSIGLLYFVLLLYTARKNLRSVWKVILSGGAVLLSLCPWLIYVYGGRGVIVSDYKIESVSWPDCFRFIFYSEYTVWLLLLFVITLLIALVYELQIVSFSKTQDGKIKIGFRRPAKQARPGGEWIWIASGLFSVFGMIAAAQIYSALFYPIIVLRYLYVSYIILWLLFAVGISKLKLNRIWTLGMLLFIFATCYRPYLDVVKTERADNKRLEETLAATVSEIGSEDFIYTDIVHFAWTVRKVYYPGVSDALFGHAEWWGPEKLPELDPKVEYWLFLEEPISGELEADLITRDREAELIVDQGFIGTGDVWIYKVAGK